MSKTAREFHMLCNKSSSSSITNFTACNRSLTSSSGRMPPLCYTCSKVCILKAVEFVFIIGVLANVLVVTRVVIDRKLRKPTFVAIACLAVCDALFLTCDLVLSVEMVTNSLTTCPFVPPRVQGEIYGLTLGIFWFAANGHLTLLAVVRFLLIVYPIKAHIYLTIRRVLAASFCVWVLGAAVITCVYLGEKKKGTHNIMFPERSFIMWIVVYLIPFALTCILHLVKLRMVRKVTTTATGSNRSYKHVNKMAFLILVILVCAVLFPLPLFIYDMFKQLDYSFRKIKQFHNLSTLLFYTNNLLNPFIYAFISPPFRRSLQDMFRNKKKSDKKTRHGTTESRSMSVTSLATDISVLMKRNENGYGSLLEDEGKNPKQSVTKNNANDANMSTDK